MAMRQRAAELNRGLGIEFPVYLLVTKIRSRRRLPRVLRRSRCGRAPPGLGHDVSDRRQSQRPGAANAAGGVRCAGRAPERRDRPASAGRARSAPPVTLYGFPQQFAALRTRLLELVDGAFRGSEQDRRMFLRGVYFTSGTQEGTPIDRLLGSLGRAAGLGTDGRAAAPEAGRAYFIEQLLRDVVLQEAGLAGTDRRAELQKAASAARRVRRPRPARGARRRRSGVSFGKNRAPQGCRAGGRRARGHAAGSSAGAVATAAAAAGRVEAHRRGRESRGTGRAVVDASGLYQGRAVARPRATHTRAS